ncbi:MAG: arylsulfatase [Verrucomicrobiota bacterium]
MKTAFTSLFVLSLMTLCAEAKNTPNIIYINTDDWGIGKVPCYGLDEASMQTLKTPNLDRLRAEGMLFTRAYAGNAVCGPSRNSLLTGKHGGNAVWRANAARLSAAIWPPKDPMLGEVARQAGYTTAAFGKISTGGHHTPEEITRVGWDYWMGYLGHVDCRSFYNDHIWINGEKTPIPENDPEKLKPHVPVLGENGIFTEDLYADTIIDFMDKSQQKGKPFFVYYASCVPHGDSSKIPLNGLWVPDMEGYDQMPWKQREQLYAALITRHDRNVGRLIDAVKQWGIEKDTIILWTSDNGDEDSYYGKTKRWNGNGPYRMFKRYLYEGGIRVPLLAWWPGTIPPGSTCDLQTTQYDLMPTIADIGGQPITEAMDGISIYPTLRGQPTQQTERDYLYWEFYEKMPQQAVHLGESWKAYRANGAEGKWELYDLSKDVGEEHNLAAQHPEIIEQIEVIAAKEHTPHPKWKLPGIDTRASN